MPVVNADGRLVGIVTDRDLRQRVFDPRIVDAPGDAALTLATLTVREVMTWGVVSVRPDTDLRAAARLMQERTRSEPCPWWRTGASSGSSPRPTC